VTTAEDGRDRGTAYPWQGITPPAPVTATSGDAPHGARAGMVTRSVANSVDVLVVVLILAAGYIAVAATRFLLGPASFRFPEPSGATLLLLGLCIQALYFAFTWAIVGGTYGDRLLGLRVTGDRGGRLGWGRCAVRAIACTVFPIGLVWVLVSRENRSLQDAVLRTSVVYD
jgi:uncharacterized RDD family membrane protein YckC